MFKGGAGFWRACSYANLAAGPRLVSTSTFTITPAGGWDLRRDDLQFDSPYNTYRYPGLPPGPIAAPGAESLRATVTPAPADR